MHLNRDIIIRTSEDGGKTWSTIQKIIDFPIGESASDASMVVERKSGKIFLFYNYMDLVNAPKIYRQHVITSADNGKTWSKPKDITQEIAPPNSENDFKFITSGRAFQTSDGHILNTLVSLQKGVFVFKNDSHGENWKLFSPSLKPADESVISELNGGNILVNSRVNSYGKRRFHILDKTGKILESFDQNQLTDPGCNASMLKIRKGKQDIYLFSNLNHYKERKNLVIRYSKDFGKTWSKGFSVETESAAYSAMTLINKRKIGILYEVKNYREIVFKKIPLRKILR